MEYIPSFRDSLYTDVKPSFTHADIDNKKYGIPELKKFPMPDAAHVRSAIRFFNYVTPSHEQQLANAILARMDEYGIKADTINIGDMNRFKKYLQHDSLMHHGIKGQKWGVRRYQNPDGSLTPAGKKKYSLNPIKRLKEKRQETKAMLADKNEFNEIQTLTAKTRTAANSVEYRYADKNKESAIWDAMENYDLDPSDKNMDIVAKKAHDYGYDYGKKTGKYFVEKYGNEAVNRYVDIETNSGTAKKPIPDQNISDILQSLKSRNAIERYAKYCAEKEEIGAIDTLYEAVY